MPWKYLKVTAEEMKGLADAALLAALAMGSVLGASALAQASWPRRSPAAAILLWQALGLAGGLAAVGTLVSLGLPGDHLGVAHPLLHVGAIFPVASGMVSALSAVFRMTCLAAGLALLAIFVMLVLLFRSLKMGLLALIPLLVGTGLTLNMMWLLDLPFNQANVLFLPLILGEGIEFGIIILARWQLEESARAITLPASTAKGVALAALTTTVGFGSLMVSGHRGTFSLGLLATVGSLSVLLTSLSALPAFLRVVERNYGKAYPSIKPYFSPGWWLNHLARKKSDEKTALNH